VQYRLRPTDPTAAAELAAALGSSSTLAQLLLQRGLSTPEAARQFLEPQLSGLTAPDGMADRAAAADRLARAVRAGETIVVYGDYDVDGTTSAAILTEILEQLGGRVQTRLANRFEGGYGFSDAGLARVMEANPSLIVTCDCGSSDHPRIAEARRRGIDVIVVDHHLVPEERLPALAFLNPHRPECGFPYKGLCSAGLVLSLGAALRSALGVTLDVRAWLDLVALGTIADVAPLDGDNRRLVRAGLTRLASSDARPGVRVLRELAKLREGQAVGAEEVAFRLAPRINAVGRLGDQSLILELLRARSLPQARALGARVEKLNDERKTIERGVTEAALAQARDVYGAAPTTGVVVAGQGWHRGVVGISAARLADALGVPVVVVALDGAEGHGSGRGPDDFPLHDAVLACAGSLVRFGGHQAAIGVTLAADQLERFRADFAAATSGLGSGESGPRPSEVDVQLGVDGFGVPLASELARLEPLGEANRSPCFLLDPAEVLDSSEVGTGHLKLRLRVAGRELSAFGFDMAAQRPAVGARIRALGALRPDAWRGGENVELRIAELEALA
jgi:single-stranded-DNA-specific exonuclease